MLRLDPDLELDDIDALVLTFAHALQPSEWAGPMGKPSVVSDYDPIAQFEKELVI